MSSTASASRSTRSVGCGKPDAVSPMLVGVPAGTDPEDQAAAADVVDGDRLLEQEGRVAERVARDQRADP